MKVAVIGPGAMGCLIASILTKAGHNVSLIDKNEERASFLNKNGIIIEEDGQEHRKYIPVITPYQKTYQYDFELIIVAVKAYHTITTVEIVKKIASKNAIVISIQNGIGNLEVLSNNISNIRLFAAVTSLAATLIDNGKVKRCSKGITTISPFLREDIESAEKVANILSKSGLYSQTSLDIQGTLWSKLIINAAICPASAIAQLPNGELLKSSEWFPRMMLAAEEGEQVAKALSINLLYPSAKDAVIKVCRETYSNFSSMLQDIIRKRPTEIDYINGAIIKVGLERKIELPINQFFYDAIKRMCL